jgi:hypothetical protein
VSKAGRRVVGVPDAIIPALREHLAVFVKDEPGALAFPAPEAIRYGGATSTRCLPGRTRSSQSARRVGTSTLSATPETSSKSDAGLRDLMARIGPRQRAGRDDHQHEARGADQLITNAIDAHL